MEQPMMTGMEQMLNTLVVLILVIFGAYAVYTGILLKSKGYLIDNRILYPGGCKKEDCEDEYGFVDFMIPRLFTIGAVSLVLGGLTALIFFRDQLEPHLPDWLNAVLQWLPNWFTIYVLPFLGLGIFIWYLLMQRKASKKFW